MEIPPFLMFAEPTSDDHFCWVSGHGKQSRMHYDLDDGFLGMLIDSDHDSLAFAEQAQDALERGVAALGRAAPPPRSARGFPPF